MRVTVTSIMVTIVPSLIHVLVISHPDDESMFFLPWIHYTIHHRRRHQQPSSTALWLLCLTTGNYNELGQIRSQELYDVNTNVLQVGFNKVLILDEANVMPDHPTQRWNISLASTKIHHAIQSALNDEYGPNNVPSAINFVTFDKKGVSGHVNHIDTYYAVQHLYQQQRLHLKSTIHPPTPTSPLSATLLQLAKESVTVWTLKTIQNPITKYLPFGEWIRLLFHILFNWYPTRSEMAIHPDFGNNDNRSKDCELVQEYRLLNPSMNWVAMSTHASQFVWYRRLFVVFSLYTYHNTLYKMKPVDESSTVPLSTAAAATTATLPISQQHAQREPSGIKKKS